MNPPANWYPDPTGRHDQRYWDGEQWTEHVFTDGVQGVDPLEQPAPAVGADGHEAGDTAEPELAALDADEDDQDDQDDEESSGDNVATDASLMEEAASSDAGGLFSDAGDGEAWSPGDEESETAASDDAVAEDVEAEDVVATLDEVADASPPDAPDEQGTVTEDAPPAAGDMSDAFILAPETASRIVKRRAAEGGQEADVHEPSGEDVETEDAETVAEAEEAQPVATTDEERATADGATAGEPGDADLGLTGDLLGGAFAERSGAGPVALQNSRLLRCSVTPGAAVVARQGTMVAYQGDVSFERQGAGGVTRALKRAATGEGLAMMRADGSGDVFFADGGQHVFLLELAGGPGLSVNGRNVLAFSAALHWDIQRVKGASLLAGGLFNTTFTGNGWVALVSDGEPVVLHTGEAPTHVDVNALVAWSAGLSTHIVNSVSAKSLVGLGSGEAFQMAFDGDGVVIVQPSEGPLGGAAAT